MRRTECPLWVISGHFAMQLRGPLKAFEIADIAFPMGGHAPCRAMSAFTVAIRGEATFLLALQISANDP